MSTTQSLVLGTGVAFLLGLSALGFAAMSTNLRFKVPTWLPRVLFALSIAILTAEGFYFWYASIFARIIAVVGDIGLLVYLFWPFLRRRPVGKGERKILIGLGTFIIIASVIGGGFAASITEPKLQVEKVVQLTNHGWGLLVVNNSTTEVAKDCVGMLAIVEGVDPPPAGSEAPPPPPFNANEVFSNHALHWANPNIIHPESSSILEVIYALYPFQSLQQGMYELAWESQPPNAQPFFAYSLLILIEINASNYNPNYTLCLFRHRGMYEFGSLEIVNNNLDTKPTIEQCENMLTQYIAEHPT